MRTGIIAKKMGMTRLYLSDGTHVPVTILSIDNCQVIATKDDENLGYYSVTVGSGKAKIKKVLKPQREAFAKIKVEPKKKSKEFKVSKENVLDIGQELGVKHFVVGQFVDATGISIGKGFAGSMKRHNFSGLRASHGVSISHRSHGSTGNSQDPGRVFKGKKMAGHMGSHKCTLQNLEVVATDEERGLLFVKGGVPGSNGSWLSLKDAIKKALPSDAPFPAGIKNLTVNKKEVSSTPKMEEKTMQEAKVEEKPVEETASKAEEKPVEETASKAEEKLVEEELAPKAKEVPAEESEAEEDTKKEKKEDSISKAVNDSEKNITDKSNKTDK